jgi:A/G-specific adenine glycosylase
MNSFQEKLINWYQLNKRDLPWRNTKNPYFIWLSEIILQQTRVDQGMNYYLHFVSNYPTIEQLANASEQEVLKSWQGLGYYSRARNLHFTAKVINEKYKGIFPQTYNEILELKGIGEYTAAAIASFAFDLPHAVLDGNVFRVLSRLFDIDTAIDSTQGKKEFANLANELLPKNNSSTYNQAIMEFGALFCTPSNPNCEACVLRNNCLSFQNKSVLNRPVKSKKTKTRNRYFNYLVFFSDEQIILSKRTRKDIWTNLYEFPLIEKKDEKENTEEVLLDEIHEQFQLKPISLFTSKKHVLSHQHIFARFFIFDEIPKKINALKIHLDEFYKYPVPKLISNFLEEFEK